MLRPDPDGRMGTVVSHSDFHVERVLSKSQSGEFLTENEIRFLLELEEDRDLARLFEAAREVRRRHFADAVFLYGFVYFSTWCHNDCIFCRYRKSNPLAKRYRKDENEIIEIAGRLAESGVHLVDLTMGEDPFFQQSDQGVDRLGDLVRKVKVETGLPLMISPGVVRGETFKVFHRAGVDWYACYQETHSRALFRQLRPYQDYDERMATKIQACQAGFLIEEGILAGVGESLDDVVTSIGAMKTLGAHQLRVMTFVPQAGTPLENVLPPSHRRELRIIAVMRLLFPDRLIPASLDVGGLGGLQDRLLAGANVVTSLIPPHTGLVGVSQSALDIDEGYRTVKGAVPILEEMGLRRATQNEYLRWVLHENSRIGKEGRRTGKVQ